MRKTQRKGDNNGIIIHGAWLQVADESNWSLSLFLTCGSLVIIDKCSQSVLNYLNVGMVINPLIMWCRKTCVYIFLTAHMYIHIRDEIHAQAAYGCIQWCISYFQIFQLQLRVWSRIHKNSYRNLPLLHNACVNSEPLSPRPKKITFSSWMLLLFRLAVSFLNLQTEREKERKIDR